MTSTYTPGWANFELELYEFASQYGRHALGLGTLDYGRVTNHGGPCSQFGGVVIPHAWIALALALPPMGSAFKHRRTGRRPGHCPRCGYDLTGNVSGVCPECGTAQSAIAV